MHPYSPPLWLRGSHRMTLYTWAKRRSFPALPAADTRVFEISPVTRVLAHCHWQPNRTAHPTVLVLHGLEGSSDAHYMKGTAEKAFARGFNVVRLNQRNCGGTDHLSEGLYHSGLTSDPVSVLRELAARDGLGAFVVVGYSLGGNLTLRMAGEFGEAPPVDLRAVCAVSPTLDLPGCMDALERPSNRIYEWHFMYHLQRRMRQKARLFPHLYDARGLGRIWSVRAFDDRYTAPHHGYRDAADYYHRAASMQVVDQIRVPTLILTAADDPFIPVGPFRDPKVTGNPAITVVITEHGGHCGFVEAAQDGYDGYWAEQQIVNFAAQHAGRVPTEGTAAHRVDAGSSGHPV
jgi:predicted alpha/beta-fold hydrolase